MLILSSEYEEDKSMRVYDADSSGDMMFDTFYDDNEIASIYLRTEQLESLFYHIRDQLGIEGYDDGPRPTPEVEVGSIPADVMDLGNAIQDQLNKI